MRTRMLTVLSVAVATVVAISACRHETPIQRAERLCLKQERAKIAPDASDAVKSLGEMGAKVTCSAGPAICEVDANSDSCKKFIETYN